MGRRSLHHGTLDVLLLQAIERGEAHGYAIGTWLRRNSRDLLRVGEGALYPALKRMQRRRWLRSEWGTTQTGRRARFYELTPEGRAHLAVEVERLRHYSETVLALLGSKAKEAGAGGG
jgi:PadR family transcriptional regulator PadR